jgi:hypothetical protein
LFGHNGRHERMRDMAEYPTSKEVQESIAAGSETMDELIAELRSWDKDPITLVKLEMEETAPNVIQAWSDLCHAVLIQYGNEAPEYKVTTSPTRITRTLTRKELEERVASKRQSAMYSARLEAEKAAK